MRNAHNMILPNITKPMQYALGDYRDMIQDYHLTQSMSRQGNRWDNAVAESFFAPLKKQAIDGERFLTREAAK